jgi:coproporphyrinogen III oxidase-like Fe-S oxidoreductase
MFVLVSMLIYTVLLLCLKMLFQVKFVSYCINIQGYESKHNQAYWSGSQYIGVYSDISLYLIVCIFQGYESKHNQAYWSGSQYIGVGPGMSQFVVSHFHECL